jgi:hypothetical protein
MKKKSDHKIVKQEQKTKQKNTRSQNYEKAKKKEEKNISFGSLKTNTELPVQRWWFKSTPKLRTFFFNVSSLFITSIGA